VRVTTWTEYALIIALHLAARRGEGLGAQPARLVADAERLPPDFTEQILLQLRRAGLVESVRGARGGYLLAREPADVTVRDVMEAAERQTFVVNCETRPVDPARCDPAIGCTIRPVWYGLQERINRYLESVTLADLLGTEATAREAVTAR
jgi:Rrf2 family protein